MTRLPVLATIVTMCALPAAAQPGADAQGRVTVGTATAARGAIARGAIVVPPGVDAGTSIPVIVVNGSKPGKVLALVAGAHGTEYASIIALERLAARLDPAAIAGTVIIVPLVNIPSFEGKVPHLNPVDGKNMNRFFPGDPGGSQTERASHLITTQVVEPSDHLIDMHGGDLDEDLRPYTYWTVTGRPAQDSISRGMALAFGLDHIIISRDRPTDPAASRYLENTATTRGKPSLTVEAGRVGTVMPEDVEALIAGSLSVMAYLGMVERPVYPVQNPVWLDPVVSVLSEQSGIFYPLVARGTYVAEGMKIGYVTDYVGRTIFEARSPRAGVVLYVRGVPSMTKGETIASIGVVAPAQ
jgi:predicted deacylase